MSRRTATLSEIETALTDLPGWRLSEGKLNKRFKFDSFGAAIGWMVSAAIVAEKMNHHPEWRNLYNQVTVDLTTHDLGNVVSTWDLVLAAEMEALFAGYSR